MKKIIFESAPEFIALCVLLGLGYALLQYYRTKKQPWGPTLNWVLFSLRAIVAFLLAFLLLGPIVKQITNEYEKPYFVLLHDNSASIKETSDSSTLKNIQSELATLKQNLESLGYQTTEQDLQGEVSGRVTYDQSNSDLHSALRRITNRYEGQKIAGAILISDGIYNTGLSPLYAAYNYPIYSVGVGDTTQRADVSIRNVAFNKIAYEGNRFPVHAEIQVKNLPSEQITVSLLKRGKVIDKQTKNSKGDDLLAFDFQPLAEEQGIQKYDIQVSVKAGEHNTRNNRTSIFVEVVEGKKKILVVAPAPHPDIKSLREVVEKNSNYELILHIPGVTKTASSAMRPEEIDLAIFHQSPDLRGKTNAIFQSFVNSNSSMLLVLGQQSDLVQLGRHNMPVRFEGVPRDFDEVTPVTNPAFTSFSISSETHTVFSDFPPVYVHFGKMQLQQTTTPLLFQRVGNVTTDKPLLAVDVKDSKKIGVMLGDGLWRWRLNEYDRNENTSGFDEVFGKLIQFLTTTDDKRKFRSYPLKQEFSDTEPVVFESQVYNDIFEPVYGNKIEIDITDDAGKKTQFSYVTSPGNIRYQIGGLKEGVFRFRSRTDLNGKTEEVRGEFAVVQQQAELQNLTADFDLLRKVSSSSGGKFYKASELPSLRTSLQQTQAKSIIHSEERYDALINLKWVFWLLLVLITAEWFLRKYHGSY